jgi:hypothetical protein
MNKFLTLLAVVLCAQALSAEVYQTVDQGSFDWHDPSAWVGGIVPPADQSPEDSIIIDTDVVLMTSLGFRGTVVINGTLSFHTTQAGLDKVRSYKKMAVNGNMRIYYDINETEIDQNQFANHGRLEIAGVLENVGAKVINHDSVYVKPGGEIINYALRAGDNGRGLGETIVLHDGTVVVVTEDGIFPQTDGTERGDDENLECLMGYFENVGLVYNDGGQFVQGTCDGGFFRGNPIQGPGYCEQPFGLIQTFTDFGQSILKWEYQSESAAGFLIFIRPLGSDVWEKNVRIAPDQRHFRVPMAITNAVADIEWGIMAVCDPQYISMENLVVYDILGRSAQIIEHTNVFPNPSNGIFTVVGTDFGGQADVSLTTIRGEVVIAQQVDTQGGEFKIDASGLAAGSYILQVSGTGKTSREIVIIE